MGWELRRGRRYYYLKVRRGGKVKSVYLGNGEAAQAIDSLSKLRLEWLALKAKATAEGILLDPDLIELGDAIFSSRRRRKCGL